MTKQTSFWNFIKENSIQIPIIQRDYAQGREGKEYIRRKFLESLKNALDSGSPLLLDFVYGSQNAKILQPLDGQQRLTTLWLMHWYIALKADALNKENAEILAKFTYETRISSREFCKQLCTPDNFADHSEYARGIVPYIQQCTWFFAAWRQDPTINAMLRMISGTKPENDQDFVDGLEELFASTSDDEFKTYWKKLTSDNSPITFYHQPMQNFGLSDDLYIKMNARGKQLSPFENFKADFISYIREKAQPGNNWQKFTDPQNGMEIKLDTDWQDFFWQFKSSSYNVDEIYHLFINRYFSSEYIRLGHDKDFMPKAYDYFFNEKEDYTGLAPYKFDDSKKEIPFDSIERFEKLMNNLTSYNDKIPTPQWSDFQFIPHYVSGEDNKTTGITLATRVVFFATCKYFIEGPADKASLTRWMRVIWNLTSGISVEGRDEIRTIEQASSAIKDIDKLKSHDVYNSLKNNKLNESSAFRKRWNEEVEKAEKILSDPAWEDKIKEAENYSFFRGSIRFLYHDKEGKVDWAHFDEKFENAKKYFIANYYDHTSPSTDIMNDPYKNGQLLRVIYSHIDGNNFEKKEWYGRKIFANKQSVWLDYLLNDKLVNPIHELLMGNDQPAPKTCGNSETEHILYYLSQTKLLDDVVKNNKANEYYIHHYGIYLAIYIAGSHSVCSEGIALNADLRNNFLLNNTKVVPLNSLISSLVEGGKRLIKGYEIKFDYNNKHFIWYSDKGNYIYKADNDYNNVKIPDPSDSDKAVKIEDSDTDQDILNKINTL